MPRLCTNSKPFYVRVLSIRGFGIQGGELGAEPSPMERVVRKDALIKKSGTRTRASSSQQTMCK